MPFDPVPVSRIATKDEFWAATPHQRLAMLSYALRHMPADHKWDFGDYASNLECGTAGCAIGLAQVRWGYTNDRGINEMKDALYRDAFPTPVHDIFHEPDFYGMETFGEVTALMVAAAIDHYLAAGNPAVQS